MNTDKVREFIAVYTRKAKLKAEVAQCNKDIENLEGAIMPMLTKEGIDRITVDGFTVSTTRTVRASAGGDMPRLIAALKSAELGVLVSETVNGSRLSSWVREFDDRSAPMTIGEIAEKVELFVQVNLLEKQTEMTTTEYRDRLTEEVKEAIKITEAYKLGCRKS